MSTELLQTSDIPWARTLKVTVCIFLASSKGQIVDCNATPHLSAACELLRQPCRDSLLTMNNPASQLIKIFIYFFSNMTHFYLTLAFSRKVVQSKVQQQGIQIVASKISSTLVNAYPLIFHSFCFLSCFIHLCVKALGTSSVTQVCRKLVCSILHYSF